MLTAQGSILKVVPENFFQQILSMYSAFSKHFLAKSFSDGRIWDNLQFLLASIQGATLCLGNAFHWWWACNMFCCWNIVLLFHLIRHVFNCSLECYILISISFPFGSNSIVRYPPFSTHTHTSFSFSNFRQHVWTCGGEKLCPATYRLIIVH